jgi:hypothetical protein
VDDDNHTTSHAVTKTLMAAEATTSTDGGSGGIVVEASAFVRFCFRGKIEPLLPVRKAQRLLAGKRRPDTTGIASRPLELLS